MRAGTGIDVNERDGKLHDQAGKEKPAEDTNVEQEKQEQESASLDDVKHEEEGVPPVSEEDREQLEAFAAGERDKLERKYLLRRFWRTATGFWITRGKDRLAWFLSVSLLVLILLNLGAQYGINRWNREIFDALEKRDSSAVLFLAGVFFPLAIASVAFGVVNVWARMSTQRRWRAWISKRLLDSWLHLGHYYQLNLVSGDHQNPEGRLTEDLRVASDAPVDFAVGVVSASLSALTFVTVLWTIGGALTLTLGGTTMTIPGFLVVAAVLYAVIASGAMVIIARRFVSVSEAKNQAEADYRYALTRVRENGESIALLGGEDSATALARPVHPAHALDAGLAEFEHHRAGDPDHPVRAEVSR